MTFEKISYVFSSDAENDLDDILEYIINDLHNSEAASSTIRTHFAIRSLCFARRGIQLLLQFGKLSRAWFPGAMQPPYPRLTALYQTYSQMRRIPFLKDLEDKISDI